MQATVGKDSWVGSFCSAVLVLLVGSLAGMTMADWINAMPAGTMPEIRAEFPGENAQRSGWELFLFILRRNLTVFVVLLLGVVSAGLVSIVVLLGNGIAIGQLIGFAKGAGITNADLASLLVPHGVLELGALCMAGAVGLQGIRFAVGVRVLGWESLRSLRVGAVMAFGLWALTAAAAVEAFVTVEIAESLRRRL